MSVSNVTYTRNNILIFYDFGYTTMQLIKTISIITLFLFSATTQAEIINVGNEKTAQLLKQGIPLIDVRMESEWKQTGVVEGSHLLTFFDAEGKFDLEKWKSDLEKIAGKDKPFMLICAVGGRTGMLSNYLDTREGYTQVHNVQRGISHWISSNKPVVNYKENSVATMSEEATAETTASVSVVK